MATAEQIAALRVLIAESDSSVYTDQLLGTRIDADGDIRIVAADIWIEKAASEASLVDVQEGNSVRKLSQTYKQALEMASSIRSTIPEAIVGVGSVSRTRPITRA